MSAQSKASVSPVTIKHPRLRDADDQVWLDFMGLLVAGLAEWARRRGVNTDRLPELIHVKLMAKIGAVLSPERIAQVCNSENSAEQRERVEAISNALKKLSAETLLPLPMRPQSGAKRQHASRDADIYSLRKREFSFGQIATRLKMPRLAAQAAYRRENNRRRESYALYKQLRDALKPLGIVLREQRSKRTSL
jgi:hypothetical protein